MQVKIHLRCKVFWQLYPIRIEMSFMSCIYCGYLKHHLHFIISKQTKYCTMFSSLSFYWHTHTKHLLFGTDLYYSYARYRNYSQLLLQYGLPQISCFADVGKLNLCIHTLYFVCDVFLKRRMMEHFLQGLILNLLHYKIIGQYAKVTCKTFSESSLILYRWRTMSVVGILCIL